MAKKKKQNSSHTYILNVVRNLASKGFIIYTQHLTLERMVQRHITAANIDDALMNAVSIVNTRNENGRIAYRIRGGSTGLDIVVRVHDDDYLVIVTGFRP
jgi:hypothetical protein